jgi:hypothetical protein
MKIRTMSAFVSLVEQIAIDWGTAASTTYLWFRGHAVDSWPLVPGLYRSGSMPELERELHRDFRLKSAPLLASSRGMPWRPEGALEWMFLMQHYGLPTRLLDWTESYLYALWFAVADLQVRSDAAVWVLDPWMLNKETLGYRSVPTAEDFSLRKYALSGDRRRVLARQPVAVRPTFASDRILAQNGAFTIHGRIPTPIERQRLRINRGKERLRRIVIAGDARRSLLGQLQRAGISFTTLFPELTGLCSELRVRYSSDFVSRLRHDSLRPSATRLRPPSSLLAARGSHERPPFTLPPRRSRK